MAREQVQISLHGGGEQLANVGNVELDTNNPGTLVILGAGPAGLSCAYEFMKHGRTCRVWDKNDVVGGLARTIEYKGYRFDIGPHRFYTKNDDINAMWHKILGEDAVQVRRLTRIFYKNRFFDYPLKPLNALRGLGPWTSICAVLSYCWAKWHLAGQPPQNFEEWVVKNFGEVLYRIFFKTYTEKVWGLPCTSIGTEWAAQRIRGLSLRTAILSTIFGQPRGKRQIKSLIDSFYYPRTGAGLVYEKMAAALVRFGTSIETQTMVTAIHHAGHRITKVEGEGIQGRRVEDVGHLFSSIPLTDFVMKLTPPGPTEVLEAAHSLYYRDHITVNLVLRKRAIFLDNWIYVHSPEVKIARVADYGNFSESMLADKDTTAISVEYFVFAHEELWNMHDKDLVRLAIYELGKIGLVKEEEVVEGFVIREKDSYPIYSVGHRPLLDKIRGYVDLFENLNLVGRGGMYKYNNQDHSILTGVVAARKYFGEEHDLWEVNTEDEYLEEKQPPAQTHASKL
ncbi:NAD(P)-binding protein [Candidatus Methylomirabilis sp.]|uniref:NAD(P)-binding protein n=1 Tax=Candidatus Methylomirabilis sp. TaxID=2032687 RepID=UPI0030764F65